MDYNLKKLLKNETIPELSNLIVDELKDYGICNYTNYPENYGGFILNLSTENELTTEQLNEVKNIVLNHNSLNFYKAEKIKQLKQKATEIIEKKFPVFKQINASLGVYEENKRNEIGTYIKGIISQVDSLESLIKSKLKLSTLEAVEIKIIE